ncbi:hypothetical protein [Brachybacterium sp. P6-10-X1]|uniref:hypothetical protein n=1 Tax=Brachybacterium sp. P6-10-X1 TaxID=1903186 RepID=UPI0012F7A34D|nr:hypothetical protein [Brachybacterium sp. P6-10-X1]
MTAGAFLLGSAFTLFVRVPGGAGPDLPGELTMRVLVQRAIGAILLVGMLCAVVAACSVRWRAPRPGRSGRLSVLAGLLVGLAAPHGFRPHGEQIFYPVFPHRIVPNPDASGAEVIVHDGMGETALGMGTGMLAIALLVAGLLVLGRWAEPTKTGVLTAAIAGTSLTLLTSIAGPGPMLITCVLAGVLGTIAGGLLEGRSARRGDLEARGGEA